MAQILHLSLFNRTEPIMYIIKLIIFSLHPFTTQNLALHSSIGLRMLRVPLVITILIFTLSVSAIDLDEYKSMALRIMRLVSHCCTHISVSPMFQQGGLGRPGETPGNLQNWDLCRVWGEVLRTGGLWYNSLQQARQQRLQVVHSV